MRETTGIRQRKGGDNSRNRCGFYFIAKTGSLCADPR
jgi:hypothetical protein